MNDVLQVSIQNNGIYSALPHLFQFIVAMSIGFLSDWIAKKEYVSTTNSRKIFSTSGECFWTISAALLHTDHSMLLISASLLGAIFFMATSFAGCNKIWVVIFLTLLAGSHSLKTPGTSVNILDLAPNYVGVIAAIVNGIGAITGILVPYIIGVMTTNVCDNRLP